MKKLNLQSIIHKKRKYSSYKDRVEKIADNHINLEQDYKNFLRNQDFGFPKYKSKSNPVQSYTTNNQNTIYIEEGYIKLSKLKSLIKIKLHRKMRGIIKSITVSKNSINHYIEELSKTKEKSWKDT